MIRTARTGFAAVALAAVLGSCAWPPDSSLPTHNDLNGYPAALLEANLVREGNCLYAIQGSDLRWLPIWPSRFILSDDAVVNGGSQVASVGDVVKLAGGEYHDTQYDFLRTLMPAEVPAECRSAEYWLVSEVIQ
jgi:hypothetical protein